MTGKVDAAVVIRSRPGLLESALRWAALGAAFAPGAWIALRYFDGSLRASPFRSIVQESGLWSMRFLVATLAVSPIAALLGWPALGRARKTLGLAGAAYALVHLWAWTRQYGYDWAFLWGELGARLYLLIGSAAALGLLPLASTSYRWAMERLGMAAWRRLHALLYPVALAAWVHFAMARGLTRIEVAVEAGLLLLALGWRLAGRRAS